MPELNRNAMAMTEPNPDRPQVKIVPPLIYLAGLAAGILLSLWAPTAWLPEWLAAAAGFLFAAAGVALMAPAIVNFRRSGTTIRPDRASSVLVVKGPYRFTRNPMYLGLACIYLGIAAAAQSAWAIVFLPGVLLIIQRAAIEKEEAFLEQRFGEEYLSYKKSVRRWF